MNKYSALFLLKLKSNVYSLLEEDDTLNPLSSNELVIFGIIS